MGEGKAWFAGLSTEYKRKVLRWTNAVISQARPQPDDAVSAIAVSGLKSTLTPCVLLSKPNIGLQLAKIANLPETELINAFRLLIALLAVADQRRRESKPIDTANHWWHRDLRDTAVLDEIRRQYDAGIL